MMNSLSFRRSIVAVLAFTGATWSAGPPIPLLSAATAPVSASIAQTGTVVQVASEPELQAAVAALTSDTTIVIAPGTYRLTSTVLVRGPLTNVTITGKTGNPDDVVLLGSGMLNPMYGSVPHGIAVRGSVHGFTLTNLTVRDVALDAVSLETGTEGPRIYNVKLIDAGRLFVRAHADGLGGGVDDGLIEHSALEYTVQAPGAESGGVHVATGARWTIRANRFRNIRAPAGSVGGPAVLMSHGSRDTTVERNVFVNCQREITLGLENRTPHEHTGGSIHNNFISRDGTAQSGAAIALTDSPSTKVLHNTILSNAAGLSLIEYRFADTTGVTIRNNLLDGQIVASDHASGTVADNHLRATPSMFAAPASGDLHLLPGATDVVDQTTPVTEVAADLDGDLRPQGSAADYGADEFKPEPSRTTTKSPATTTSTTSNMSPTVSVSSTSSTTTTASSNVDAIDPITGLPSPWMWMDIGNPLKKGTAGYASGTFIIDAAGADIAGSADQFGFAYRTLEGDGDVVAYVASLERTHPNAKAAVMIRDELTAGSKYAAAVITPDKGLFFQYRIATGSSTSIGSVKPGKVPYWLKLTRAGNVFTMFASVDGRNWMIIGSEQVYLNRVAYVGLAVTSRSKMTQTTAKISGVSVTQAASNQPPSVSIVTPASGSAYNAPCGIQIDAAASDSDGSVARVDFYAGSTLLGSADRSPFRVGWSNVPVGRHRLTAIARDERGASTTSAAVEIVVVANQAPVVSITAPTGGASYAAPATIAISASASDPDGTITGVDFFAGGTLVGTATTAPYGITWSGAPAGTHSLTAAARDNSGNSTTSAPVSISVVPPVNQPPVVTVTAPSTGSSFAAGSAIELTAAASDSDGSITKVEFFAGSTLVGSDTSAPYSTSWSPLSGTYTVSAKAWDNSGAAIVSAGVNVTIATAPSLPTPWQTADVGNPAVTGSASYMSDAFTLKGAGTDIWNTADQFRFVYQPLAGDGDVTACVNWIDFQDNWAKAGVMIRESLSGNAPYAYALLSGGWGADFQHRTVAGAFATQTGPLAAVAPHCVRLVRKGNEFQAFHSVDGTSWAPFAARTIAMSANTYVGLAVTSHNASQAATAKIDRVNLGTPPPNQPPTVAITAPASDASFTSPSSITISASASDPDGSVAQVDFYAGSAVIGSDTTSPFSILWNNPPSGTHHLTAVARDNSGATAASSAVRIAVSSTNRAPSITLSSPGLLTMYAAPATVALAALAADADGTVARVDFYVGNTLVGSDTTSPYGVSWNAVTDGTYGITAVAHDNSGASASTVPVTVSVSTPVTAPTTLVFTASADHATSVTSYTVEFFAAGTSSATGTPVRTQNVGKPAPVNGEITVDIQTAVQALPAGNYYTTVSATGPGGSTRSAPSPTLNR